MLLHLMQMLAHISEIISSTRVSGSALLSFFSHRRILIQILCLLLQSCLRKNDLSQVSVSLNKPLNKIRILIRRHE